MSGVGKGGQVESCKARLKVVRFVDSKQRELVKHSLPSSAICLKGRQDIHRLHEQLRETNTVHTYFITLLNIYWKCASLHGILAKSLPHMILVYSVQGS